jgi:hypothetical protein
MALNGRNHAAASAANGRIEKPEARLVPAIHASKLTAAQSC